MENKDSFTLVGLCQKAVAALGSYYRGCLGGGDIPLGGESGGPPPENF